MIGFIHKQQLMALCLNPNHISFLKGKLLFLIILASIRMGIRPTTKTDQETPMPYIWLYN